MNALNIRPYEPHRPTAVPCYAFFHTEIINLFPLKKRSKFYPAFFFVRFIKDKVRYGDAVVKKRKEVLATKSLFFLALFSWIFFLILCVFFELYIFCVFLRVFLYRIKGILGEGGSKYLAFISKRDLMYFYGMPLG